MITLECVDRYRRLLEKYIGDYPEFLTTLEPFEPLGQVNSAILAMCEAARLAGVGPMAAVAGLKMCIRDRRWRDWPDETRQPSYILRLVPIPAGGLINLLKNRRPVGERRASSLVKGP